MSAFRQRPEANYVGFTGYLMRSPLIGCRLDVDAEDARVDARVETLLRISRDAARIFGQTKAGAEQLSSSRIMPPKLETSLTSASLH